MTICEKLGAIQQALKAPKSEYNDFGKYNYRTAEGILEAVKPFLAEHKCVLLLRDDLESKEGRVYIKATAQFFDAESAEPNKCIEVTAFAREEESKKGMDASQVTGAASSYARKYALNGLFCIDDNKDSDATNDHGKGEDKPQSKPQTKPKNTLDDVLKMAGGTDYYMCESCGNPNYPFTKKDGSVMTAKEMLEMSMRDFHKPLCKDCYKRELANAKKASASK